MKKLASFLFFVERRERKQLKATYYRRVALLKIQKCMHYIEKRIFFSNILHAMYVQCVQHALEKKLLQDEDETTKAAESAEAESAPAKENDQNAEKPAEKPVTPAKDTKEKEGRRGRILSAIRFPSVSVSSVFSRKKKVIFPAFPRTIIFKCLFFKKPFWYRI